MVERHIRCTKDEVWLRDKFDVTKLFVVKIGLAKAYIKGGLCLSKNTEEETSIFFFQS